MGTSYCWIKYVNAAHIDGDWAGLAAWAVDAAGAPTPMCAPHGGRNTCRDQAPPPTLGSVDMSVLGNCPCCTRSAPTWPERFAGDAQLNWATASALVGAPGWQLEGPSYAALEPNHEDDPAMTMSPPFASRPAALAWLAGDGAGWSKDAQGLWLISHAC